MSKAPQRVSVVRIPRHLLNQYDSYETRDEPGTNTVAFQLKPSDPPPAAKSASPENEQADVTVSKLHLRPTSSSSMPVIERDDESLKSALHQSPKPSVTVQNQPLGTERWVRPSFEHRARPHRIWEGANEWTFGLSSVFDDFNLFCYACMCWCCFRHELSSMMNEHWCVWFVNCWPLMELRTKFRTQYAIQGSIVEDCCVATCCPLCVALQLAHEGREHGHRIFT